MAAENQMHADSVQNTSLFIRIRRGDWRTARCQAACTSHSRPVRARRCRLGARRRIHRRRYRSRPILRSARSRRKGLSYGQAPSRNTRRPQFVSAPAYGYWHHERNRRGDGTKSGQNRSRQRQPFARILGVLGAVRGYRGGNAGRHSRFQPMVCSGREVESRQATEAFSGHHAGKSRRIPPGEMLTRTGGRHFPRRHQVQRPSRSEYCSPTLLCDVAQIRADGQLDHQLSVSFKEGFIVDRTWTDH